MKPKISVIIAAYNEEKLIGKCIEALLSQKYPKDLFEIIVVDNGSSDKTSAISKKLGAKTYIYQEVQGCAASREYGKSKANGHIIAFTDADSIVPSNWLKQIDKLLSNPRTHMVSGRAIPDEQTVLTDVIFGGYHWFFLLNNFLGKPLIWGFNMAIKKTAYEAVGGMDTKLLSSDDWDLALRIQDYYGRKSVRYVTKLQTVTSARKQTSMKSLYRYSVEGVKNYVNLIIFGRRIVAPVFNVR